MVSFEVSNCRKDSAWPGRRVRVDRRGIVTYMITYLSSLRLFATVLSGRRLALGLSPAELAARCDMNLDTLERLEQGSLLPSPSQAFHLGVALDLDPVDLGTWAMQELLLHPECLAEVVQASA